MVDLQKISSSISYSPYFAFLLSLDAEWSRRRTYRVDAPYLEIQQRVMDVCKRYVQGIEANYAAMHNGDDGKIPGHLFNPMFYMPWGHADCQVIILLDDFDLIHHMTCSLESSIEEIGIGFCPTLASFSGTGSSPDPYLVDLSQQFEGEEKNPSCSSGYIKSIQSQMPLLVFTRYKLDALASVGFGLQFQAALFSAIRKSVNTTLASWKADLSMRDGIEYEKGDEHILRMAIVDLQGAEELGSLIFCRNYSVAMTVIAGLRNLTYNSLFASDTSGEQLRTAIGGSRVFKHLMRIQPGPSRSRSVDAITDNHVFRWTRTTLAVSPHAFFAKVPQDRMYCHGCVSAVAEFQIPPGHVAKVRAKVRRFPKSSSIKPVQQPDNVTMFEVGHGDYLVPYTGNDPRNAIDQASPVSPAEPPPGYLSLADAIQVSVENLQIFGTIETSDSGRDVVDCSTVISVPVPSSLCSATKIGPQHFPMFGAALREIQMRLCYPEKVPAGESSFSRTAGRLSLVKLRSVPKTYGIPEALRRSIECLYQHYAILLGDYYEFDSVIDLYDAFATLHASLTEQLKEVRKRELQESVTDGIPLLDDRRVGLISGFVEALRNALSHRLTRSFSEPLRRDMAIDLRGGLNQVLAAADVPLKCGLGLLRKYVLAEGEKSKRDVVGGLTRLSLRPRMRAHSLHLGTGVSSHLCFVEADVPHILNVVSFCDYLHEGAHLVFGGLLQRYPDSHIARLCVPSSGEDDRLTETQLRDRLQVERLNEIFANVFIRLFLFLEQPLDRFVIHQLIANEKSRNGLEGSNAEMIEQVSEFLVRLCISDQLIAQYSAPHGDSKSTGMKFQDKLTDKISRRNAIERIIEAGAITLPDRQKWM
jgi:hypothetical protein